MNESTKTKKALRGSLFALFLCIVLLIGTTFAWFTDTASTGVNKIQAGNLKVGLKYSHDGGATWKEAKDAEDIFAKDALWEPGHVEYVNLKVSNLGNLALKYKLGINVASETLGTNVNDATFKLSDYLKMAVVDGATKYDTRDAALIAAANGGTLADYTKDGRLAPHGKTLGEITDNSTVTVIVYMPETVGNEANYKTGTTAPSIDMGIEVNATQLNSENDSFGPDYDKNATYPVASASELKTALNNGGTISVTKDINTNNSEDNAFARMVISNPTTLNLDKKIISPDNMENNNNNFCALYVTADTTINAGKNGGVDTGANGGYGINVMNGAKLTINGGYYYGGGTTVQVQKGTLIINDGTFACDPYDNPIYGYNFQINCIDGAYKNGTAKVIIKGGTFINFDPSNNTAEGAGTNFVADGYKVVPETHGSDTYYKVEKK